MKTITALDLFAGTGWGVACRQLGIREMGVEIMPEACATREANGMATIYHDVWEGLEGNLFVPEYELLIASPPCQTFSLAGKGAGRAALDDVLEAIESGAYLDPAKLREFGELHDPRTALVLTPLAHVARDRPTFVAFEQVPTVLPVWEACAEVMREMGYSVKVANLQAEQYGVPQTRKRAVLVARLDGEEVQLPTPTHSRYYSRDPKRMDEGVLPWVSMAEALGWGDAETRFTQNNRQANQAVRTMEQPAPTVTAGHDSGNRGFLDDADTLTVATPAEVAVLQSYPMAIKNMGAGMVERHGERPGREATEPAFTIRASAGGTEPGGFVLRESEGGPTRKLEPAEVATLQSYPPTVVGFPRRADSGETMEIGGESYRARDLRPSGHPAQTVTEKARSWSEFTEAGDRRPLDVSEVAALQTFPTGAVFRNGNQAKAAKRTLDQPAPTIHFGQRSNKVEWVSPDLASDPAASGERVTVSEASTLQTYERPFVWKGSKTKQFLQIGNAVPPLLAETVLAALVQPKNANQ